MSRMTQCHSEAQHTSVPFPWCDAAIVALVTVVAALVFAYVELSETLFVKTRAWEHLQLDELPGTLLVLSVGMAWFAWRRYVETRRELVARRAAETQLASLLDDHRRLAQQHVQLQEAERKTLARELHDELGQYLNAIKTDAVTIQRRALRVDRTIHRAASAIVEHCDHVQETVRALVSRLRPTGLDVLGLRAALEHFFDLVRQSTPQRRLIVRLEGDLDHLDDDVSLAIYRLVQEGLTNVSKHAGARSVHIHIARAHASNRDGSDDEVTVALSDDGRGADPHAKTLGLGLLGMRERVEMLDGTLEIRTAPGKGFSIHARIPARARRSPRLENTSARTSTADQLVERAP